MVDACYRAARKRRLAEGQYRLEMAELNREIRRQSDRARKQQRPIATRLCQRIWRIAATIRDMPGGSVVLSRLYMCWHVKRFLKRSRNGVQNCFRRRESPMRVFQASLPGESSRRVFQAMPYPQWNCEFALAARPRLLATATATATVQPLPRPAVKATAATATSKLFQASLPGESCRRGVQASLSGESSRRVFQLECAIDVWSLCSRGCGLEFQHLLCAVWPKHISLCFTLHRT